MPETLVGMRLGKGSENLERVDTDAGRMLTDTVCCVDPDGVRHALILLAAGLVGEAVLLQLAIQGGATDPEQDGGGCAIVPGELHGPKDGTSLHLR